MPYKIIINTEKKIRKKIKGSLTVEAALILPIFLYFFIAFLYFIQIITVQEYIQEVITKKGLSIAKMAYLYGDFLNSEDAENFDNSLLGEEFDVNIRELSNSVVSGIALKNIVISDLDVNIINNSCIQEGYEGISFYDSKILNGNEDIDIVIRYGIHFPVFFFHLNDMYMIQRVRLRGWTGYQVPAKYTIVEEDQEKDETIVYITETGTVYHLDINCSHLKFSIVEIHGLPTYQRNENGGKYYPCEACCRSIQNTTGNYYITSFGDRYHTSKICPKLKRTIREIPISEVGGRSPCKRCGK